jgi:zinc protease
MMVVGDVDLKTALTTIKKEFGAISAPQEPIPRFAITEFKQEGLRRVEVKRPSQTNIIALGFKHPGFPTKEWFVAQALLAVLTDGPESILERALVDTGIATSVEGSLEPTSEENLGFLTITLAEGQNHAQIEAQALKIIESLTLSDVTTLFKKVKAKEITEELFARDSSQRITQDLTEYTAAGDWTVYTKTVDILESITPKEIVAAAHTYFTPERMIIGYFIGMKS